MGVVDLYMTDFCPFAQRAWLAFGEKEADPKNPKLYNYIEVNYFNPDLPLTQEFLKLHNTVPAGRYEGQELKESLPIAYWVDEHYKNNPLQPATAEGVEKMKALITKFTSGTYDVTGPFYQYLFTDDDEVEKREKLKASILGAYAELSKEIEASGGPYLLGQQFTIADIAVIPFVDRGVVLLGHYRGLVVPDTREYAAFHAWRKAYASRPAYQVTNADRLPRSVAVQPFAATKRDEYIIEMYAGYANNVRDEARVQLRHAPPGKATLDLAQARQLKQTKKVEAAKKAEEEAKQAAK